MVSGWTRSGWVWYLRRLARLSKEYHPEASRHLTSRADYYENLEDLKEPAMKKTKGSSHGATKANGKSAHGKCSKCGKKPCQCKGKGKKSGGMAALGYS